MQSFLLYYGTTLFFKIEKLVIIRFLFFYTIKIGTLGTFERKTTEHGLAFFRVKIIFPMTTMGRWRSFTV